MIAGWRWSAAVRGASGRPSCAGWPRTAGTSASATTATSRPPARSRRQCPNAAGAECGSDGPGAAQVTDWFRQAEDKLGPAGAMVSCAGIPRDQPLARLTDADWRAVIDTGLDGVFQLCRAAMFAMMKQRSGRIVTVSSVCAAYDHSAPGHDATTRPGMAGFVKALAGQAARFGISVNAVTPGPLTHDMT